MALAILVVLSLIAAVMVTAALIGAAAVVVFSALWGSAAVSGALLLLRGLRTVRLSPLPSAQRTQHGPPILFHWSDLHITRDDVTPPFELRSVQGAPPGDAILRRVEWLVQESLRTPAAAVVITGDVTDTAHEREWARAIEAFSRLGRRGSAPLVVVPGNHDLVIAMEHIGSDIKPRAMGWQQRERLNRWARFEAAIGDGRLPQAQQFDVGDGRVGIVIGINSNGVKSRWIATNAMGLIVEEEFATLHALLTAAAPKTPVIVALHHHVAWPSAQRRDLTDLFMITVNGRRLLENLARYNSTNGGPVLVLHGHKHLRMSGCYKDGRGGSVTVYGSASSTLGACPNAAVRIPNDVPGYVRIRLVDDTWDIDHVDDDGAEPQRTSADSSWR